jgi:hypothetical protein
LLNAAATRAHHVVIAVELSREVVDRCMVAARGGHHCLQLWGAQAGLGAAAGLEVKLETISAAWGAGGRASQAGSARQGAALRCCGQRGEQQRQQEGTMALVRPVRRHQLSSLGVATFSSLGVTTFSNRGERVQMNAK